jgi:hypothetical protein
VSAPLTSFCLDALAFLTADAAARGMPKRGGTRTIFSESGAETGLVLYDDYMKLVDRNGDALCDLSAYGEAAAARDLALKAPHQHLSAKGDLLGLIYDLVQSLGLTPTSAQLGEMVQTHLAAWQSGLLEVQQEVALVGLAVGLPEARLGEGVTLRALTPESRARYWNEDAVSFSLYTGTSLMMLRVREATYLLAVAVELPRQVVFDLFGPSQLVTERALTALRLALAGRIGAVASRSRVVPKPVSISGSIVQEPLTGLATRAHADDVVFDASALERASAVYADLGRELPPGFTLALRRFGQSFERPAAEDVIVDLAIAAEATLLHGLSDELGYRLQVLGAALLGSDPQGAAQRLKRLYTVRGRIVHGAELVRNIVNGTPDHIYAAEARTLIAEVLSAYLRRLSVGKSMAEIRKELEAAVLSGLVTMPKE